MYQLNSHKPNNVVEIHTYMHFIFYWNGSINIHFFPSRAVDSHAFQEIHHHIIIMRGIA